MRISDWSSDVCSSDLIGRRLTEELTLSGKRHRLLMMLDEFPALGRLDFFESALAFMAGYGLKSFLIAQSLNQIERSEEHTSELQSLMRISYDVLCLKKKKKRINITTDATANRHKK